MKAPNKYQQRHIFYICINSLWFLVGVLGMLASPATGIGMIFVLPICFLWAKASLDGVKEEWGGLRSGGVRGLPGRSGMHCKPSIR